MAAPSGRPSQGEEHAQRRSSPSAYELTGVVASDPATAFQTFRSDGFAGRWQVVFFWPMDFTFVCPTEIAEFGRRDARVRRPRRAAARREHRHAVRAPRVAAEPPGPAGAALPDARRHASASSRRRSASCTRRTGVPLRATFIVDPAGRRSASSASTTSRSAATSTRSCACSTRSRPTSCAPCNWKKGDAHPERGMSDREPEAALRL